MTGDRSQQHDRDTGWENRLGATFGSEHRRLEARPVSFDGGLPDAPTDGASRFPWPALVAAVTVLVVGLGVGFAVLGSGGDERESVAVAGPADGSSDSAATTAAATTAPTPVAVSPTTATPTAAPPPTEAPPVVVPTTASGEPVQPTPTPLTEPDRVEIIRDPACTDDLPVGRVLYVVNIEPDDPDGGLVFHTAPGVTTGVVEVVPPGPVRPSLRLAGCSVLPSGAVWWQFIDVDGSEAWANARWLSDTLCPPTHPIGVDTDADGVVDRCEVDPDIAPNPCDAPASSAVVDSPPLRKALQVNDHIQSIRVRPLGSPAPGSSLCVVIEVELGDRGAPDGVDRPDEAVIVVEPEPAAPPGIYHLELPPWFDQAAAVVPLLTSTDVEGGRWLLAVLQSEILFGNAAAEPPVISFDVESGRMLIGFALAAETDPPAPWSDLTFGGASDTSPPSRGVVVTSVLTARAAPGLVEVSGIAAAFEGVMHVRVVDADGVVAPNAQLSTPDAIAGSGTERVSLIVGNPGVAWAEFSIEVNDLPRGEWWIEFTTCDQCGPDFGSQRLRVESLY